MRVEWGSCGGVRGNQVNELVERALPVIRPVVGACAVDVEVRGLGELGVQVVVFMTFWRQVFDAELRLQVLFEVMRPSNGV